MRQNVALGLISGNEMPIIEMTLGSHAKFFNRKVAIDTGITDGSRDVLSRFGFEIGRFSWNRNYSDAFNSLLDLAEKAVGIDWLFIVSPDESVDAGGVEAVNRFCSSRNSPDVGLVKRYNISGAFNKWDCCTYPDTQARIIRLRRGLRFAGKVHEIIVHAKTNKAVAYSEKNAVDCHLFHYSHCKPKESVVLKNMNYDLYAKDLPKMESLPEGFDVGDRYFNYLPDFDKPHPLSHMNGKLLT